MSLLTICQSIQNTTISTAVRESTWGFPVLGALHVLALAWFGGALVIFDLRRLGWLMRPDPLADLAAEFRGWRWFGVAVLMLTGALLFWVEPLKCYQSISFRLKMALLILMGLNAGARSRLAGAVSLLLWIAVVFAARGIAFF